MQSDTIATLTTVSIDDGNFQLALRQYSTPDELARAEAQIAPHVAEGNKTRLQLIRAEIARRAKAAPAGDGAITPIKTVFAPAGEIVAIAGLDFTIQNTQLIGLLLGKLYRDVQEAEIRIIRFGVAFLAAERLFDGPKTPSAKMADGKTGRFVKGGFSDFLRRYAPDVPETTGRRYLAITEAIIERFKIEQPETLFFSAKELPKELSAKKEEVREFLSSRTIKAVQLELGLTQSTPDEPEKQPLPKTKMGGTPASSPKKTPAQLAEEFHWSKADRECYADMLTLSIPGSMHPERLKRKLDELGEKGREVFFAALPATLSDCELGFRKPGRGLPGLFGKAAPQKGREDVDHLENMRVALTKMIGSQAHWDALITQLTEETQEYPEECYGLWRKLLAGLPGPFAAIAADHFAPRKK